VLIIDARVTRFLRIPADPVCVNTQHAVTLCVRIPAAIFFCVWEQSTRALLVFREDQLLPFFRVGIIDARGTRFLRTPAVPVCVNTQHAVTLHVRIPAATFFFFFCVRMIDARVTRFLRIPGAPVCENTKHAVTLCRSLSRLRPGRSLSPMLILQTIGPSRG
jgi:hypothetical protein